MSVTLEFTEATGMWPIVHLAKKYAKDGCVKKFIEEFLETEVNTTFKDELLSDMEDLKKQRLSHERKEDGKSANQNV